MTATLFFLCNTRTAIKGLWNPCLKIIRHKGDMSPYEKKIRRVIGNREQVGYGTDGEPSYFDYAPIPFPAIRFKEPTPDVLALRQKEKGDWRLLTIADKKAIYRSNFCQTYVEFLAPTHEWMGIVGLAFCLTALGAFLYIVQRLIISSYHKIPQTLTYEGRKQNLKRIINLKMNPITGLASKWDYDKMEWKKSAWFVSHYPNPFAEDEEEECVLEDVFEPCE